MPTGDLLRTLTEHTYDVSSICVSSDGQYVVSGNTDQSIQVWELSTGRLDRTFTAGGCVTSVWISCGGRYVVYGSFNHGINILELPSDRTASPRQVTSEQHGRYSTPMVSGGSDGRYVVGVSDGHPIKIWETSNGVLMHTLTNRSGRVISANLSSDNRYLVSGSHDGLISVWEISTGVLIHTLGGLLNGVSEIWASPDNHIILKLTVEQELQVWQSSVIKHTIPKVLPGNSFWLGRDGNVYEFVDNMKFARLVYSPTINAEMVNSSLASGQLLGVRFSVYVAAALLNLPTLLDEFVRAYGNVGIDEPQPDTGMSALTYALFLGHSNVVEKLLCHGSNHSQQFRSVDGSLVDATSWGYCHHAAMEMEWMPASTRQYMQGCARGLPFMANELNDVRNSRLSDAVLIQIREKLRQQISKEPKKLENFERYREIVNNAKAIIETCPYGPDASWTLDNTANLNKRVSDVESLRKELDKRQNAKRVKRARERVDELNRLLGDLSSYHESKSNDDAMAIDFGSTSSNIQSSESITAQTEKALQALDQWQRRKKELYEPVVKHTERAAVVVQSRLKSVGDCYERDITVLDPSVVDVHSALEALQGALSNEKLSNANNGKLLRDSFPSNDLIFALQAWEEVESERYKQLKLLRQYSQSVSELRKKLKNATKIYAKLKSDPQELKKELAFKRLDMDLLLKKQALKSADQARAQEQKIHALGEEVKQLAEKLKKRQSNLVALSEAGCSDALNAAAELEGITWSQRTIDTYEIERSDVISNNNGRHILHKAFDCLERKQVVLKEYAVSMLPQLNNELELLKRVRHKNVVSVCESFADRFKAYMVLPFFKEGCLEEWVLRLRNPKRGMIISIALWRTIWMQVLYGLQALHSNRIVHGNINPRSIFVLESSHMVVGDFDFSQDTSPRTATITRDGRMPVFLASELQTSSEPATTKADMFAFGTTVRAVMTTNELTSARSLLDLVLKCESPDPAHRPSADDALDSPFFALSEQVQEVEQVEKRLETSQAEHQQKLEEAKRQANKTVEELQQEQAYVLSLQRKLKDQQELLRKKLKNIPVYWSTCDDISQRVDISNISMNEVQSLFDQCTISATLGSGLNQQVTGQYRRLQVEKIWRVESTMLWGRYQLAKQELQMESTKGTGTGLERVQTDRHKWVSAASLDQLLNEKYLFHGTKHDSVDHICNKGFDERIARLEGMFGAGIYFAEHCSKSDQYVTPDPQGLFYMFVCRVLLGTQVEHTQNSRRQARRPNEVPDQPGRLFDSLVYDANRRHYGEFIVYDRTHVYPEYLVAYRRQ
eukprot:GILK01005924.1.p1 GENE.GILK01005924.1~~GILK01005924.1.p1  ORF type:complete len:1480 (+),score=188.34 GILK01005924.1:545-4441(+)